MQPSVTHMSVKLWPRPTGRIVCPEADAAATALRSSSSERGRASTAGAQRCWPAQFVHTSAMRAA